MTPLTRRLAGLALGVVLTGTPLATGTAAAVDYRPQPVPYTDSFERSRPVAVGDLAGTGISLAEARSVKVRQMRYDVVDRGGVPTARIRTTLRAVLPDRPRYRQTFELSFDEERVLLTDLARGRTRFLPGYGGPAVRGCGASHTVDGRVLTQYVRLSCLLTDTSEMSARAVLVSTRTGREVGSHGRRAGWGPFLRWRS